MDMKRPGEANPEKADEWLLGGQGAVLKLNAAVVARVCEGTRAVAV